MLRFILRRLGISALILFLGSILLFVLTINAGDPLDDLLQSRSETREREIELRTERLNLDQPWYQRYWTWLVGVAGCLRLQCDFGTTIAGVDILGLTADRAGSTLRLVTLATLLAIVIGVSMGIVSAIRQYSGLDYAITFIAFLFFSLPLFWAAVWVKQYGIGFNDWIADPSISLNFAIAAGVIFGVILAAALGGDPMRRVISFLVTAAFATGALMYFEAVSWWTQPALGLPLIIVIGLAAVVCFTVLTTGLGARHVLAAGALSILAGVIGTFVFGSTFTTFIGHNMIHDGGWVALLILLGITVLVSGLIGYFLGGYDRGAAMTVSIGSGLVFGIAVCVDQLLRVWPDLLAVKPRPLATLGSGGMTQADDFWVGSLDWLSQLLLPSIVLCLLSLAAYSRYTRASMLEVLGQDYIRTARSKGLSERVVITRHALRNAMIPLTTIVAFDFAGLIGGAVVTETVFGWPGMGLLFVDALRVVDPGPVMAFYLVSGTATVVMNMLADIAYASLDPRIRR